MPKSVKVALVYDWVDTKYGGAENVLLSLHQLYPQAPLYTSVNHPDKASWAKVFQIRTSFIQYLPHFFHQHQFLILLAPLAFESFDLSGYDLIISISSGPAKGVMTKTDQLHINYCLTPPRYLYSHRDEYLNQKYLNLFPIKQLKNMLFKYLLNWDQVAQSRPDVIIPISQLVKKRILDHYSRKSAAVIYPPVFVDDQKKGSEKKDFYLIVARLVAYKKIYIAIQACQNLNKKLIVVGKGNQQKRLKKMAQSGMTKLIGNLDQPQLHKLYNQAKALIMVGEEDFGITGLEALAHQTPLIVNQSSGVAELVEPGKNSILIANETVTAVEQAIKKFESSALQLDQKQIKKFAHQHFKQKFSRIVNELWENFLQTNR